MESLVSLAAQQVLPLTGYRSARHPRQAPNPCKVGTGSWVGGADRMQRDRRERPGRGGCTAAVAHALTHELLP